MLIYIVISEYKWHTPLLKGGIIGSTIINSLYFSTILYMYIVSKKIILYHYTNRYLYLYMYSISIKEEVTLLRFITLDILINTNKKTDYYSIVYSLFIYIVITYAFLIISLLEVLS